MWVRFGHKGVVEGHCAGSFIEVMRGRGEGPAPWLVGLLLGAPALAFFAAQTSNLFH
jgi:hypothetical protein